MSKKILNIWHLILREKNICINSMENLLNSKPSNIHFKKPLSYIINLLNFIIIILKVILN